MTPRSWLLRAKLSNGALVYGLNRRGYGGRGIFVYGDAIEPELEHLGLFLDRVGIMVDVGASTGVYALKAAKHFRNQGVVVAVEPSITVLSTLARSVERNGFANVRLRNLCLGAKTGSRTLWMNERGPSSFSLVNRVGNAQGVSVLTVSLDDLFRWEKLDHLSYLKIDTEGAESEIVTGGLETVLKHRPILQVESAARPFSVSLDHYSAFRAPASPNLVMVPREHPKIEVPTRLGWLPSG